MIDERLEGVLEQTRAVAYIDRARDADIARSLGAVVTEDTAQAEPARLPRLAFIYETQGLLSYQEAVRRGDEGLLADARGSFAKAFSCWQALASLPSNGVPHPSRPSEAGVRIVESELDAEPIAPSLSLALRIAVAGVMAEKTAEMRLSLRRFSLEELGQDWRSEVANGSVAAFVLLARKAGGWADVDAALGRIGRLRDLQANREDAYIELQPSASSQTVAAMELVALYHMAQLVTLTADYLRTGDPGLARVLVRLDLHSDRAAEVLKQGNFAILAHLAALVWAGCREAINNSIWSHISGLGEAVRKFVDLLTSRGRPDPVLELWPSQQEALRKNLLDPYRRAVLVEMPTSSGKTLLAKFSIVQARALNPQAVVTYVVPTRALVNQVTSDLRSDFRPLGIAVEQAIPAFELDPTEDRLLSQRPGIIVTTPEKLDLLVRRDHPAVRDIALVIADEAHNIRDEGRGPRLELLLGMLKRDRPGARFLLLSPYLPNDGELVSWLGDDRALPPIAVDWKPSNRMVGVVEVQGRGHERALYFETLPAAANSDVRDGLKVRLGAKIESPSIARLTRETVGATLSKGSVLILCRGQGTATTRARELSAAVAEQPTTPERTAVSNYLDSEIGRRSSLADCLEHGVAYHHAGLSQEARWLVEGLIRRGQVQVICGTTTLAQGVNFPISTVIIETLDKGDRDLTYQDFWNIAGRAGRALMDSVGVVAFPAPTRSKRREYEAFLQGEAEEISSQLLEMVHRADEIADRFDMNTLRRWPHLSAFLQFLAHALRVSERADIADELEEVLRASLVYHQARREDASLAQSLVSLSRRYLLQIRDQRGLLSLADKTGFATPSVLSVLGQTRAREEFADPANWRPERLFGQDTRPLRERVEAIAGLPEMQLGQGAGQPFNSERVAGILRDWVGGSSLDELANRYLISHDQDADGRLATFNRYLFSQLLGRASWGIGALESIALAGRDDDAWRDIGYVPSMIYFGVSRREAVWLRMVGVPRVVADGLGGLWEERVQREPGSYDEIREWVSGLSDQEWRNALPTRGPLTPQDMRVLWAEFTR